MLLFLSPSAFSQPIHWGVTARVPLTDYFRTTRSLLPHEAVYKSSTNPYTVGAVVGVRLTQRMNLEFNVLYKGLHFSGVRISPTRAPSLPPDTIVFLKTTANLWEAPVVLKYRSLDLPVGTYVEGGASFQRVTHIRESLKTASFTPSPTTPPAITTTAERDEQLMHPSNAGIVMGGGIEFRVQSIRVSPGFRSTLWLFKSFRSTTGASPNGLLDSSQSQVEFLLGITF